MHSPRLEKCAVRRRVLWLWKLRSGQPDHRTRRPGGTRRNAEQENALRISAPSCWGISPRPLHARHVLRATNALTPFLSAGQIVKPGHLWRCKPLGIGILRPVADGWARNLQ